MSGEQLMGDRPADAASPPPGELCRIAIVTRDPLSFLLSHTDTSALSFDSV